jgi:radical SAM enzyme (TIGR01210 family)
VGCQLSRAGSCTMCNYGIGETISESDIICMFEDIRTQLLGIKSILIGTNGSIFDVKEIPTYIFDKIIEGLRNIDIDIIIFETHYTTVTYKILDKISCVLKEKDVVIEMGLESSNEYVLSQCLNKPMNLNDFREKINLIHNRNMSVSANVFLGAPFLCVKEQIYDTFDTITWAIKNNVDNIIIFPANIRENTLLSYLYRNGRYSPLSSWALVELLNWIPTTYHDKIYLSWYGDWNDINVLKQQESCDICKRKVIDFFNKYLSITVSEDRKAFVELFMKNTDICHCYSNFLNSLDYVPDCSIDERIQKQQEKLLNEFKIKI